MGDLIGDIAGAMLSAILLKMATISWSVIVCCAMVEFQKELFEANTRCKTGFGTKMLDPLTFKAIHWSARSYLRELVVVKENRYRLRSSNQLVLCIPKGITKKTIGDRAFAVAAPRLWNSLPEELRGKSEINDFKRHLKAHFFTKAFSTP